MPYYKELYLNRSVPVSTWTNGVMDRSSVVALDSTELMSFRARRSETAYSTSELSSQSVDPYAYFLESTSRKKYRDRLRERGLQPEGDPDRGHAFELKRHTRTGQLHDVVRTSVSSGSTNRYQNCYVGPPVLTSVLESVHAGNIWTPAPYKETGLDAFAQQAYARSAPTGVVFDAGVFLGELREGLPRLIPDLLKNSSGFFKSIGSDYLNVQFGWIPFLNDIQNAARALSGATELLSQQGKRVHRRYSLPEARQFESVASTAVAQIYTNNASGFATAHPQVGSPWTTQTSATFNAAYTLSKSRSSHRWFEGEFTSFFPLGFNPDDYFQRLSVLVNPRITPATLWELAPWSWLVDWNLRIGDTIRANEMNANDLLVMHYGYAMETSIYTTDISWRATSAPSATFTYSGLPSKGAAFATTMYKRRLRANPYGFRTGGTGGLTGSQTAILGALGLTKLK